MGCELELPWVDPNDPNYESDGDENIVNDAPAHLPTKNGGQPHGPNINGKSHGHGTTLKTMVPEMSEEDVNKGKLPIISNIHTCLTVKKFNSPFTYIIKLLFVLQLLNH